ncbi:MAG: hypothetical protein IPO55_13875 [Alphaproteobacteria bacterium]|nr:hypothetical protein [Alphaproteobacteria bacterium]
MAFARALILVGHVIRIVKLKLILLDLSLLCLIFNYLLAILLSDDRTANLTASGILRSSWP